MNVTLCGKNVLFFYSPNAKNWSNDCPSVCQEAGWLDARPSLETVKSVDELLELLYPEYGLLQQCLRRKAHRSAFASSYPSFPDPSASPLVYSDDEDVWAHSRKEALYKMDETLEGKSNHSGGALPGPLHKR